MSDKKIEIEVPKGYKLVRDGMKFEFVKKDERFLSWEEKDSSLSGYYIDVASGVYTAGNRPRQGANKNIFAKESQARGALALAMLSQQLADVNQDWVPKWSSNEVKYCIVRNCTRWDFVIEIEEFKNRYHFLAFKTREDAEKFLKENLDELLDAGVFI